jgi:hypothetical protein
MTGVWDSMLEKIDSMNEANRMTRIREMLREKERKGLLGVVAASANYGEHNLFAWLRNPVYAPSRDEVARIEKALFPEPTPQRGDSQADA